MKQISGYLIKFPYYQQAMNPRVSFSCYSPVNS